MPMQPALKLTAIVRLERPSEMAATASTQRAFFRVDEFLADVGNAPGLEVSVVEGTLADAPDDGILLVFDGTGLAEHRELCGRTVLINADRSRVPACLEELKLLAAVEKHRYFLWQTEREGEDGSGLFGRKDIAELMGAEIDPVFSSRNYALISCERYSDLAALLAGYVTAYARHMTTTDSDGAA